MRFPKRTVDVDAYLKQVSSLLSDDDCHIFIDTNIISQLFRLNEDARKDFYKWIKGCGQRFHVPVWSILEYSRRVRKNSTKDYISDVNNIKTISDEFHKLNKFIKGYMGESMLTGTQYASETHSLFADMDKVEGLLSKISSAIKNKISDHISKVQEEVIVELSPLSLRSDIYSTVSRADEVLNARYDGEIPPGFEDGNKKTNSKGDLVIWMEILDFCTNKIQEKKASESPNAIKAILLTRDQKDDWVYEPSNQNKGSRKAGNSEKIRLAHESLVYEFWLNTGSNDFYVIDFETLVKLLARQNFRDLAKSFQLSEENSEYSNTSNPEEENHDTASEAIENDITSIDPITVIDGFGSGQPVTVDKDEDSDILYSGTALMDEQYVTEDNNGFFDGYISKLMSYDWYVQNPAINELMKLKNIEIDINASNKDSTFVLGRNILQSAEGSSGSAITFMEHLAKFVKDWPVEIQCALIDGMLYEVFFDSKGQLRHPPFKATYFEDLLNNIRKLSLKHQFDFINRNLKKKSREKWVPEVGSDKQYTFILKFDSSNNVEKITCDGNDITDTYPIGYFQSVFAHRNSLKFALSAYYAIPEKNIILGKLPDSVEIIYTRKQNNTTDELPF